MALIGGNFPQTRGERALKKKIRLLVQEGNEQKNKKKKVLGKKIKTNTNKLVRNTSITLT